MTFDEQKVSKVTIIRYCNLFLFLLAIFFCAATAANAASYTSPITQNGGGTTIVPTSSDITTTGDSTFNNPKHGMYSNGEGAKISAVDDIAINTSGHHAYGVGADNSSDVTIGGSLTVNTSGNYAYGALAKNNSNIEIGKNANITTTGTGSYGVEADSSDVTIGGSLTVDTSGYSAYGAYAQNNSSIEIVENANITTTGTGAYGVKANSSDVTIGGSLTVDTSGDYAYGAEAINNSSIEIGGASVTTTGIGAYGVHAGNSSDMTIGGSLTVGTSGYEAYGVRVYSSSDVTIGGALTVDTSGDSAYGAHAQNNSSIEIGDASITTTGVGAYGVHAGDSSDVTIHGSLTVDTSGDYAYGVEAYSSSDVTIGGAMTVDTSGDYTHGAMITENSSLEIGSGANITTSGNGAIGAMILNNSSMDIGDHSQITTTNVGSHGLYAETNSLITIGNSANITTSGNDAFGAVALANSSIDIGGSANITTFGNRSHALYANNGSIQAMNGASISTTGTNSSAVLSNNGLISVNNGTVSSSGAGSLTMRVENGGKIEFDNITTYGSEPTLLLTDSGGSISADNGTRLLGDVVNANNTAGNTLDITLGGSSYLEGAVNDTRSNAVTNLTLNGSGDNWRVTGDSLINGVFTNNGRLDYSSAARGTTVTVGDLDGNGRLVMKTDIAGMTGDMLIVSGTTTGSHIINVANSGGVMATGSELLTLVKTADRNGSFTLANNVAFGAWTYSLRQVASGTGAYWELYSRGESSAGASGGVNTFYANYLMSYTETQTLMQRLGDLRAAPLLSGFWFRLHGGNFESNAKSFVKPFDMDYWGVQLGYDRKFDISWDGNLYAGVMFGYSKGDLDLGAGGSGDLESKMVGLYGTYIAPGGFFTDLVLKYQWMDNEFDVFNPGYERVTGDGVKASGFGAAMEFGQRIHFKEGQKTGWYMEPQVQLSYMRYDGDYFNASNGLHVGVEPFTSILGRLGMLIGYETDKTNFYGKISKVKEFDGDVTIVANSQHIPESFSGSWWVYGVGYTSKINDRNSIYIDIERTSGGSFRQTWAAKAGWRMEF